MIVLVVFRLAEPVDGPRYDAAAVATIFARRGLGLDNCARLAAAVRRRAGIER